MYNSNSMKKIITASVLIGLVIAITGYIYAHSTTDQYVATINQEIVLLEALLNDAAERIGESAVSESEARSYYDAINTHLTTINDHPHTIHVTGFQDHHVTSLESVIEKLEEFLVVHKDTIVAIETATDVGETEDLLAKKSSGEQLFGAISNGLEDTKDIITGHIEDV